MKKWLSLLLALLLLIMGSMASFAEEAETFEEETQEAAESLEDPAEEDSFVFPEYSYEELTVGNPTPVEGNFFTDMWGNNTGALDVRQLLHGQIRCKTDASLFRLFLCSWRRHLFNIGLPGRRPFLSFIHRKASGRVKNNRTGLSP